MGVNLEDWERVELTMLRGRGICWSMKSNATFREPLLTVCGLTRSRAAVRIRLWDEVTCPACVQWLKGNPQPESWRE